jgi:photosystem II stability/assembly factor-like uncharacterized protein
MNTRICSWCVLAVALAALVFPAIRGAAETTSGWKAVGWGGGGFYWACAFHPSRDGVIYLGGDVNGFYKTTDGGKNWRISNAGLSDYAIYSMAADAKNPDTVYVGTPSGTCRSTDAGEHWEFLPDTDPKALAIIADRGVSVRALAVDPASGAVFAGTPAGKVFKSTDGGRSWKKLYEMKSKGSVRSVAVSPCDSSVILAATAGLGVVMTTDGGTIWKELATPKETAHVAVAPGNGKTIYAACGKEGVWKSTDRGRTWSKSASGLDPANEIIEVVPDQKKPGTVYTIGNTGWGGSFYRSEDGGKTWKCFRDLKPDLAGNPTMPEDAGMAEGKIGMSALSNIACNPRRGGELFIAGNWRNEYSADGGRTWEERDRGTDITCVTDIRFLDGTAYVTAMDEGLLASADGGATWKPLVPRKYDRAVCGHQWRVAAFKSAGHTRIVSTLFPWDDPVNRVLVSDDGGASFKRVQAGLPDYLPKANCMWGQGYGRALAVDPRNPGTMYLGIDGDPEPGAGREGGGIFKSVDGGSTWNRLPAQPASRRMFYGLAVDPTVSKRIYWGACGENGGLHMTGDGGKTWKRVFDKEAWIFNVEVSPSGVIYCPGNNLWKSADHGATWEKITSFTDSGQIVGLEIKPGDERTVWISRVGWSGRPEGGVYQTTDGGAAWKEITGDIPHRSPLVLRYDPASSELWAGGVGLYKIKP